MQVSLKVIANIVENQLKTDSLLSVLSITKNGERHEHTNISVQFNHLLNTEKYTESEMSSSIRLNVSNVTLQQNLSIDMIWNGVNVEHVQQIEVLGTYAE